MLLAFNYLWRIIFEDELRICKEETETEQACVSIVVLTVRRFRTCGWQVGWSHWNWYRELCCGVGSLIRSFIVESRPWLPGFWPLVKEWLKRLALLLQSIPGCEFATEERMLRIPALEDRVFGRFWCREREGSRWHHWPCVVVHWCIHLNSSAASWCLRKETMHSSLRSKPLKIPVIQLIHK